MFAQRFSHLSWKTSPGRLDPSVSGKTVDRVSAKVMSRQFTFGTEPSGGKLVRSVDLTELRWIGMVLSLPICMYAIVFLRAPVGLP